MVLTGLWVKPTFLALPFQVVTSVMESLIVPRVSIPVGVSEACSQRSFHEGDSPDILTASFYRLVFPTEKEKDTEPHHAPLSFLSVGALRSAASSLLP